MTNAASVIMLSRPTTVHCGTTVDCSDCRRGFSSHLITGRKRGKQKSLAVVAVDLTTTAFLHRTLTAAAAAAAAVGGTYAVAAIQVRVTPVQQLRQYL